MMPTPLLDLSRRQIKTLCEKKCFKALDVITVMLVFPNNEISMKLCNTFLVSGKPI